MENKRAFLLDVFRIILCLGVVLYHYTPARPSIGPFMVNGFLIMSGFLIGRMFISCPSFDVVRFYHNKAKRLLPMFTVALLMGVLWHGYTTNTIKPEWTVSEWGNFSMIGWMSYFNTPLWYMGVEFAMLLIVPILYCIFSKKWLLIGFTLLTTIVTWSLYCQVPDNTIFGAGLYFSPLARCWQFVVGILSSCVCEKLYIFSKFHKKILNVITFGLFALFLVFVGILSVVKQKETLNFWNYSFTFDLISTIFYISFIPCLFTCAVEVRSVWKKQFKYMAELTYPLFLIHVPLLPITARGVGFCFGPLPQWVSVWTACFAAVIGSMIMLKIESICRKGFSSSR